MPRIRPLLLIALVIAVVACVRHKAVVQQDGLRRLPHIAIAYAGPSHATASGWFVANDPASRLPSIGIDAFGQAASRCAPDPACTRIYPPSPAQALCGNF